VPLTSRAYTVRAEYKVQSSPLLSYTDYVSFELIGALIITGPATDQEMSFTLSGTNGTPGASVDAWIDLGDVHVGNDTVGTGGAWSVNVQMPRPGPTLLVADQTYRGVTSQRNVGRAFKIKPPKLTNIQVTYPSPGTVKFSGVGYGGARVDILSGGTLQVDTAVNNDGSWSVDWLDQPPSAARQMNARQGVPDGMGGWIYSNTSDNFTVTVPVPVPSLSVTVGADRKPAFSGFGHSWPDQPAAQIEVRRVGESTPAAPIVDVRNDRWSTAATEAWNPGTYSVEARQLFNGISSQVTEPQTLIIRPPPPTAE
jgi:hypothetical protein